MNTISPITYISYRVSAKPKSDNQNAGGPATMPSEPYTSPSKSNNNISFSGIGAMFRESNSIDKLRKVFSKLIVDINDINELNDSLSSITQSKSILKILSDEPDMSPAPDPSRTNATEVLCDLNAVKAVTGKLKDLGVQDPLNEVLKRTCFGPFLFFPNKLVNFMESLLEENNELLTKNNVKTLSREVESLVEIAKQEEYFDKGICKQLTETVEKLAQKADNI